MVYTFTLSTILAIAIPLGVVALVSILVLGIVTVRYSAIAHKERRAYELARRGDYRRGSLSRLSAESEFKRNRRTTFFDLICCIPSSTHTNSKSRQGSKLYSPQDEEALYQLDSRKFSGNPMANFSRRELNHQRPQHPQHSHPQNLRQDADHREISPLSILKSEIKDKTSAEDSGVKPDDTDERPIQAFKNTKHRQGETTPPKSDGTETGSINRNYYFPEFTAEYGSDVPTPESILSVPEGQSLKSSILSTACKLPKKQFSHYFQEGEQEFVINSGDNSAGVSGILVGGADLVEGNSNNSPVLPTPPGITAPSPHRPMITGRVNSNIGKFEYDDVLLQNIPSFASKPRSLTLSSQIYEPLYPAKSELRSKASYKRDTNSGEDSPSIREYYSAHNSLRSTDETGSFSFMKSGIRNEQQHSPVHQSLNQATPNKQASGWESSPTCTEKNVQNHAKTLTYPKIDEMTVATLAEITETNDGFADLFKSPESYITMTPPPPPSVNRHLKSNNSPHGENRGTFGSAHTFERPMSDNKPANKVATERQASRSNNSVIDPDRILKVLQRNEQIVEGRERVGRIQVDRSHSSVPSYTGSVVPSQISEAQMAQYSGDLLRTYQLSESMSRASYSSESKQSTPADKLTAYERASLNPINLSTKSRVKSLSPIKTPEKNSPKQFSKTNVQLSSPLSSPSSSYIAPSRNSSLSAKSFGRSRSFLQGNGSANHFKRKIPKEGEADENYKKGETEKYDADMREGTTNSNSKTSVVQGLCVVPYKNQDQKDQQQPTVIAGKSRARGTSYGGEGTISTIAALHPPASPRSPGYEPSKGALITSTPLAKAMRKTTTSVKRLSAYAHLKNKHIQVLKHASASKGGRHLISARINKPLPSPPIVLEDGVVDHLCGAKFIATVAYKSRLSDELDLEVGDIVRVNEVFDDNWCRARIVQSRLPIIGRNIKGVCPKACLSSGPT